MKKNVVHQSRISIAQNVIGIVLLCILLALVVGGFIPTIPNSHNPVLVKSEQSVTIGDVKSIGPSVVTIEGFPNQELGPRPFFLGMPPSQSQQNQPETIGSGFIVTSNGVIVTNKHVIADNSMHYEVITANDKKYSVKNIYQDPRNDIAIVTINPSQNKNNKLIAAPLGNSANLQVGQFVVAIGTALGQFRNTVTTGIISGLGRGIMAGSDFQGELENLNGLIQTSAAINFGNSGGPLVNAEGQVIGMNTAIAANGQDIGFALPINTVKDFINTGM